MKRTLGIMICFAMAACGQKANSTNGTNGTGLSVGDTGPDPRFIGRVQANATGGGTLMAWSGTAAETHFNGSQLTINMSAAQPGQANRVAVLIDGAAQPAFLLVDGQTSYQVNVAAGDHEARLVKLTEAGDGQIVLNGFATNGRANSDSTKAAPGRLIEFVGDSITAGFGDEAATAAACPSDPTNMPADANEENALKAYGPLTATTLNADYSVIAWSGKGVYENRNTQDPLTMPDLFTLVDPTNSTSTYNFTQQPDVVVVDLGTNDFSAMSQGSTAAIPASDQAPFTAAYVSFIQKIRAVYPQAYIVVALGPMLSHSYPAVQDQLALAEKWINGVVTQVADPKVSFIEFPANPGDYGCDDHPNAQYQQIMSTQLVAKIQGLTGWK